VNRFAKLFPSPKPVIGVIHLPPLPGFDGHPGMARVVAHALADLRVLMAHEVEGVLIENEYDRPHQVTATAAIVAAMKEVTHAVVAAGHDIVVGCEILLNDPRASLTVAAETGGRFIRSDYFVDRMSRQGYGEFAIDPAGLVAFRDSAAPEVLILADIQVKYATMIEARSLQESARLAAMHRADAIVVTGDATGDAPRIESLREAAAGIASSGCEIQLLIGSGLNALNAASLLSACDGASVGTALMHDRKISEHKTARVMAGVARARSS
jgi:membrane complex biogenesis BtpA family protein